MKRSVAYIALITTMLMTSAIANGNEPYGTPTSVAVQRPTVIRNVQVRANVLRIQKPKLFVGNPYKSLIRADDWDYDLFEVDDVITPYRRKDLVKLTQSDDLSEHVRWRLFLARQLAMLKFKEVHS
jgi:hypothetical protein